MHFYLSKTLSTQNKIFNLICMSAWYTKSQQLVKKINKSYLFLRKGRRKEVSKFNFFLESLDAFFDEFSILHDASIW